MRIGSTSFRGLLIFASISAVLVIFSFCSPLFAGATTKTKEGATTLSLDENKTPLPFSLFPHTTANADLNKAVALLRSGKYNDSLTYFDKALAINPNSFNALDNKGAALLLLKKYNDSLTYFDKALAVNPNFIYALVGKGIALVKLGEYNDSLTYFDKALAITPQDPNALIFKKAALSALHKK